jgi:hypothetical protein
MSIKAVIVECDLCFCDTDGGQSLRDHVYGIRGCDMDNIERQVEISHFPRQEHEYEDVNGKEIHLCHACLKMLCEKFVEFDTAPWERL